MPLLKFSDVNLHKASLAIIDKANAIIAEYQQQGLDLTLRQLYYQFVARGFLPNNDREYKKLGNTIANARLAGLIDWEAIVDRTRFLREQPHWKSPVQIIDACAAQFRLDKWMTQPNYVEVWIEKDALIGVIETVCQQNDVPYLACRGYASASEVWEAGYVRMRRRVKAKKQCVVLYLGDHDPSGLDMTRDVQERLDLFAGQAGAVEVRRLALNIEQVQQYNPPPNPTKMTDSRASNSNGTGYVERFGLECWELDALNPTIIRDLIQAELDQLIDRKQWAKAEAEEQAGKGQLAAIVERWDDVCSAIAEDGA